MRRPRKIVEVTWIDAQSDQGGWEDASALDRHECQGATAVSLGFLVDRNKNGISIAASLTFAQGTDEVEQIGGTFIIPAGMIRKVRVLK